MFHPHSWGTDGTARRLRRILGCSIHVWCFILFNSLLSNVQILCFWTLSIVLPLSKNHPVYFSKHNVSETGFCLRLQVKPTQLGPIDRASPCLVYIRWNLMVIIRDEFWKMRKETVVVAVLTCDVQCWRCWKTCTIIQTLSESCSLDCSSRGRKRCIVK
jgi:hypothetical protein